MDVCALRGYVSHLVCMYIYIYIYWRDSTETFVVFSGIIHTYIYIYINVVLEEDGEDQLDRSREK